MNWLYKQLLELTRCWMITVCASAGDALNLGRNRWLETQFGRKLISMFYFHCLFCFCCFPLCEITELLWGHPACHYICLLTCMKLSWIYLYCWKSNCFDSFLLCYTATYSMISIVQFLRNLTSGQQGPISWYIFASRASKQGWMSAILLLPTLNCRLNPSMRAGCVWLLRGQILTTRCRGQG